MGIEENLQTARDSLTEDVGETELEHDAQAGKESEGLLSRLEQLEKQVQNEIVHENATRKKVERIEEKLEGLETGKDLEERIDELEQKIEHISRGIDERIDERVEKRIKDLEDHVGELTEAFNQEIAEE